MTTLTAQQAIDAARDVAATLAQDANRDSANAGAHPEVKLLRDAALPAILLPREVGGSGLGWDTALRVVRELSASDGSVGRFVGFHYINQQIMTWLGNAAAVARWGTPSAEHQWLWGDAVNLYDPALTLVEDDGGFRLSGRRSFATGLSVGDVIVLAAAEPGAETPLLLVVPREAAGVLPGGDWDGLEQRPSASGSVTFTDVAIDPEQVIGTLEPVRTTPRGSLLTPVAQAACGAVYLGVAQGALRAARDFTRTVSRPFLLSGAGPAAADPYLLLTYGRLVASVRAAEALADDVDAHVARVDAAGADLTWDEHAELAGHVAALRVVAEDVALNVTSTIFEVTGVRATSIVLGLERFWRNAHAQHNPIAYEQREVGARFLTGVARDVTVTT